MGVRGPIPKADRIRRNKRPQDIGLISVAGGKIEPPAPSKDWAVATVEAWADYWTSPVASTISRSDLPALRRLFDYRDELARCHRAYRRKRLVTAPNGAVRMSPMLDAMRQLEGMIRPLELQFGVTPAARARLGIKIGEAARSLTDVMNEVMGDDGDTQASSEVVTLPTSSRLAR